ncbi:hypothetical protein K3495_g14072 [Podosphaera aphanis]|nr:hypothetical protein K3495_g14072 [Podosphaera aphanis]
MFGLQTDNTLAASTTQLKLKEELELQKAKFDANPIQELTKSSPINFNGAHISISVTHHDQVTKIVLLKDTCKHKYVSQRARGSYIASVCQPQVAFGLSYVAQITNPTSLDMTRLNKS